MLMCFLLGIYNIRVALIKIFPFRWKMLPRLPNLDFGLAGRRFGTRDKFFTTRREEVYTQF